MRTTTVTLECDVSPLELFINLIKCALKVSNGLVNFGDFPSEFVRIENDLSSTDTSKVGVVLYPSDAFLRFATTIFAGDLNFSIIKDISHD